jgi:hypothetical protein
MDKPSTEAAASFLERYAMRLHGMTSLKWTGEFDPAAGVEARLVLIAAGLRRGDTGLGEEDATFLRGQAETLRSPNRLVLDDPMVTAEWRQASETAFETAERLEAIAELIAERSR